MLYQEKLYQRAAKQEAEQLQMQEASELFMDEVQKGIGKFLPQDVERIKGVEQGARNTVYDAVKQSGGDLKRFYMMGGHKILREYRNSIAQSKEVSNAKTLDDLKAIAKERGYKRGWAQHIFNARKSRII